MVELLNDLINILFLDLCFFFISLISHDRQSFHNILSMLVVISIFIFIFHQIQHRQNDHGIGNMKC